VDADQIGSGAGQLARRAAGRPDQRLVADAAAVAEGDLVRGRIDRCDAPVEQQVDLALGPEFLGPDQDPLERLLAREIFLRKRRALIRRIGLVAQQRDRALELVLAQCDGRLGPP